MPNLAMTPFDPRLPKDRPRDMVIDGRGVDMLLRILLNHGMRLDGELRWCAGRHVDGQPADAMTCGSSVYFGGPLTASKDRQLTERRHACNRSMDPFLSTVLMPIDGSTHGFKREA